MAATIPLTHVVTGGKEGGLQTGSRAIMGVVVVVVVVVMVVVVKADKFGKSIMD